MSQVNSQPESFELLVRDAKGEYRLATGDEVLKAARQVIGRRIRRGTSLTSPEVVRDYLRTKLAELPHEVFFTLLLDWQDRLVQYVELFRGTLSQTSVYPREVVKVALAHNAAAMILAHNHPSGIPEPSRPDELLIQAQRNVLNRWLPDQGSNLGPAD